MQIALEHPSAGVMPGVANPIRLSRTPVEYRRAPPVLGQHTDEVLGRLLGLDDEALRDLRANSVIS